RFTALALPIFERTTSQEVGVTLEQRQRSLAHDAAVLVQVVAYIKQVVPGELLPRVRHQLRQRRVPDRAPQPLFGLPAGGATGAVLLFGGGPVLPQQRSAQAGQGRAGGGAAVWPGLIAQPRAIGLVQLPHRLDQQLVVVHGRTLFLSPGWPVNDQAAAPGTDA